MTNAELIEKLHRCIQSYDGCSKKCEFFNEPNCHEALINAAADAIEAADKRIAELAKQAEHTDQVDAVIFAMHLKQVGRIAELEARLPKEGEWIIDGMNEYQLSYGCVGYEPIYRCSKCGITTESYLRTERPIMPEDADFPNYCPNCGCRMDGETEYVSTYSLGKISVPNGAIKQIIEDGKEQTDE